MKIREIVIAVVGILIGVILLAVGINILKPAITAGATDTPQISHFSGGIGMGNTLGVNQVDGLSVFPTSGACTAATSTLFAIQNPYNATSTVTFGEIYGTMGATTTDIAIGTSTSGFINTTTTTTTPLINYMYLASVATSTQFFAVSGAAVGPNLGYNGPTSVLAGLANDTMTTVKGQVVVGPSEYLVAYATSSYANSAASAGSLGGNGTGTRSIPSSCFYSFEWQR